MPMSLPSGPRNTKRKPPPTRRSTSQTTSDQPRGPNQRLSSSGLVNASHTSRRGASKTRVSTISRSVGVVTCKVPRFFIGVLLRPKFLTTETQRSQRNPNKAECYDTLATQLNSCFLSVFSVISVSLWLFPVRPAFSFFGFHLLQQRIEALEAGLPDFAIIFQPVVGVGEGFGFDPAKMRAADDTAAHQPGPFQHADVLGGGGKRHA